jgi:hypothetical protein
VHRLSPPSSLLGLMPVPSIGSCGGHDSDTDPLVAKEQLEQAVAAL